MPDLRVRNLRVRDDNAARRVMDQESIQAMELRAQAALVLAADSVNARLAGVAALQAAAAAGAPLNTEGVPPAPGPIPGRPPRPVLVDPQALPQRGLGALEGRQALLHAVAHIEFNAIGLALDHAWRFAGMPEAYYRDWLQVATEEAHHFELVRTHLRTLGADYGDFQAHDGLWQMCERTADDLCARMALVPRMLEARGLDVTPAMRHRLAKAGDLRAAEILDVILRDEIGHVAIGDRWYRHLCVQQGVAAEAHFTTLRARYRAPPIKGPLNRSAREAAGFTPAELDGLIAP